MQKLTEKVEREHRGQRKTLKMNVACLNIVCWP